MWETWQKRRLCTVACIRRACVIPRHSNKSTTYAYFNTQQESPQGSVTPTWRQGSSCGDTGKTARLAQQKPGRLTAENPGRSPASVVLAWQALRMFPGQKKDACVCDVSNPRCTRQPSLPRLPNFRRFCAKHRYYHCP